MSVSMEKVVSIRYTLKDKNGDILDGSDGQPPLTYRQALGKIIPCLENQE